MAQARTDWKEHTPEDFRNLDERVRRLGLDLIRLFEGKPYSIIMANDYSGQNRIAEDSGPGDRRFIGWLEIKGPTTVTSSGFERVAYLRLHTDEHIETDDRTSPEFEELFGGYIRNYKGQL